MKAFTERSPKVIGIIALGVVLTLTIGALSLNAGFFSQAYPLSARFSNGAGLRSGDQVLMAGVQVGKVSSLHLSGNSVIADLQVNSGVQLPSGTSASIVVETLLGQVAVSLVPGSNWSQPIKPGTLITNTTVPTEFMAVQDAAGPLLAQSNAKALNQLLADISQVTSGKRAQLGQIMAGLNKLLPVVNQRRAQVAQLIGSTTALSNTLNSRDQQLLQAVGNLDVILSGLAQRRQALASLIDNTQKAAAQTASIVGANKAQLDSLIANLTTDLNVIARHQVDLAQGVSYLGAAVTGWSGAGYSGPSSFPNTWINIFTNPSGFDGVSSVFGSCGLMSQVMNVALGPDPVPCSQAAGPLPGSQPSSQGSSPAPGQAATSTGSSHPASSQAQSSGSAAGSAGLPGGQLPPALGGVQGLDQIYGKLLG
ncbi:MAG: MCE family protein [Acidimicrobiales bacterium]